MRAKKRIDGLECDFQPTQPEWRMGARVQADVAEFLVGQLDVRLRTVASGGLRIADRWRVTVPLRTHFDGRAVHRIEQQRTGWVSAELQLDGAESTDDHVFEDLLGERAEGIVGVGCIQVVDENGDSLGSLW